MPSRSSSLRRARPLLGTIVDIAILGGEAALEAAMVAAFQVVEAIHELMSFHVPDSDVSRLNRAPPGADISVSPHTAKVLRRSQHFHALSGGAFDIAVAPRLVDRGFLPRHADHPEPDCDSDTSDLIWSGEHRLHWRRKGWVDLGGIAKGYAVDCAIAVLQACGVDSATVNAGGDIRCFGEPMPVRLRHPLEPGRLIAPGYLADAAIATSAGYFSERDRGNGREEPLIDPMRGACVPWRGSVSVIAADCTTADALTKIVRLAPTQALEILDTCGAQALIVDQDGIRSAGRPLLRQGMEA